MIPTITAILTFSIALATFYIAVRSELKKNAESILSAKIADEKRHSSHEQQFSLINERLCYTDSAITYRLDTINRQLAELRELFFKHINEHHNERN